MKKNQEVIKLIIEYKDEKILKEIRRYYLMTIFFIFFCSLILLLNICFRW